MALKAFHEPRNFTFIIVGVWLADENRLIQFNGDLRSGVVAVNADAWSAGQLSDGVEVGETSSTSSSTTTSGPGLIEGCFESVSVVQTACHQVSRQPGYIRRRPGHRLIGKGVDPYEVI